MRNGFSIFEMLIALSIMALLGSFVIPNIQKIQLKSYSIASEINLKTFQSSIENYYLDNNTYPVGTMTAYDIFTLLNNSYIMKTCPQNPYYKNTYSLSDSKGKITYNSTNGDDYTLTLFDSTGTNKQLELNSL